MAPGSPNLQMPQFLDRWNFSLLHQWHYHPKSIHFDVNLYYVAFVIPVYFLCYILKFFFRIHIQLYQYTWKWEKQKMCEKSSVYQHEFFLHFF